MWQKTKHGLYKQFNFINFKEAFEFINQVAQVAEQYDHYPRWENEWNVVNIWLSTHEEVTTITDKDIMLSKVIDSLVKAGEPISEWTKDEKKQQNKIKMYADGGSRGNPGPSASGYVLLDLEDKIIVDEGVYLGITTNNQAEYTALKLGLEAAKQRQAREVDVYMDSLLVVNQMRGIFKVKNRDLWPIHSAITEITRQFDKVTFTHVPRELNKLADAAVNRALDKALGISQ